MEIQYYGANCVRIVTKKAAITIDDTAADIGGKSAAKPGDVMLFTGAHGQPAVEPKIILDQPGEYEVSDTSIHGVGAQAHLDESGENNTMFKVTGDDIRLVALGNIHPDLSDDQLEALGTVDVLVVPVGGNGYTLDPVGATKVIKKIDPKIVIPVHYADQKLNYEVPQVPLEEAMKTLPFDPKEAVDKVKLKSSDLGESTQLIVLARQ